MPAMYLLTANEKFVLFLSNKMRSFKTEHWSSSFSHSGWKRSAKTGFCNGVVCFQATACRSASRVVRH
jgi:hypothetical protein